MRQLAQAVDGFKSDEGVAASNQPALKSLGQWLGDRQFGSHQSQFSWLIKTKQWAVLSDRFY
jgi:hypothetical protein